MWILRIFFLISSALQLVTIHTSHGADDKCAVNVRAALQHAKDLVFCRDCQSPNVQGSLVSVWPSFYGPEQFQVIADLAYAVPNDARWDLMNSHEVDGKIVLIDRGEVALVTKVLRAQEAGAKGVVLVDDGSCQDNFECGPLGSKKLEKFAQRDFSEDWRQVKIPSVFIMKEDGDRIKSQMDLVTMNITGLGKQYLQAEE